MRYRIVVERMEHETGSTEVAIEIYRQTVEELSLPSIISAVNKRPRKPRTPRQAAPLKAA